MTTNRQQQDGGAWRELMAAVLVQAVKDTKSEQPEKALDAVLFLTGDDVPLWMEAVGLPDMDALTFVTSGQAGKVGSFFRK